MFSLKSLRPPIIQAPMAGSGINTTALVVACSSEGVLGSVATAYRTPDAVKADINIIRDATESPFAVNVFAPTEDPQRPSNAGPMLQFLSSWHHERGLEDPHLPLDASESFSPMIEQVLELNPPVLSFTFGLLPKRIMRECRTRGIFTVGTATSVEEAVLLEASGVDAIVAQGYEAGGHRGSFASSQSPGLIGLIALVPQVVDAVRVPIIASGGIMDGRGLAAALALGAHAVQMGTAFLATHESGAPDCYKEQVTASRDVSTVLTDVFSGRLARGIENEFIRKASESKVTPLPYPWQNALTRPLRAAGVRRGDAEVLSLWAGQGSPMATRQNVGELIHSLDSQLLQACRSISDRIGCAPSQSRG